MQKNHWFGLIPIIVLAFTVTSCVQPASDEIAPTQVGVNATFTYTPPPTATFTESPEPTVDNAVEDEATLFPTATATATATATPTDAQSAIILQNPTFVAQDDGVPIDPNAPVQQDNTGAGQISPSLLTATAIIEGATATTAFQLTGTAAAQGIGVPTIPPTATQDPALQAPIGVTPVGGNNVPGADCFHEVKAQDRSLYRLSLAYGVQINRIAQASGIVNPDLIRVGQMLTIPGCGTTGAVPPATSTPNPVAFAGNPGTGGPGNTGFNVQNPTGDCTWGTSVIFPNGCPGTGGNTAGNVGAGNTGTTAGIGGPGTTVGSRIHTVDQGETLYEISLLYGVTMDAIASANGISNYDNIDFNAQLVIP